MIVMCMLHGVMPHLTLPRKEAVIHPQLVVHGPNHKIIIQDSCMVLSLKALT
jgi:hypothetical protein